MKISVEQILGRLNAIRSDRNQFDNHFQQCADFSLPQRNNIQVIRSPGTKLKADIFDSTAIAAIPIAASGLHSHLTNPSSRWFGLKMRRKDLNDILAVKQWLGECEEILFDYFNSSNLNEVLTEWYSDFMVFGNATLYQEEDPEEQFIFHARPISEIYFLVNSKGVIDTVYRVFTYTARQASQQWGDNAGKKVADAIKNNKMETPISFVHCVMPRAERDVGKKDNRNMPFASVYIEPTYKKILSESGYHEFPFFIPRFYKTSDSQYAYSPVSVALADIKMINRMSKNTLEAEEVRIHPPIIMPNDGYLLPFKRSAKAINYKLSTSPDDKVEVMNITGNTNNALELANQRRQAINRALYVDLFLMLANLPDKQRTATEIQERAGERLVLLAPALGRMMKQLSNMTVRSFYILYRNGELPSPPPEIIGQDFKVDFLSPLAKAQRVAEVKSISDLLMVGGELSKFFPEVTDNLDGDVALRKIADALDSPSDILREDKMVAQIRKQRAEGAQMAQQAELLKTGGAGAKSLAEADAIMKEGGAE